MAKTAVAVGLQEKADEVAARIDFEMSGRLANLLDLALDCQNRDVDFEPVLILKDPTPAQVDQLRKLVQSYKDEGRAVWVDTQDDDAVRIKF